MGATLSKEYSSTWESDDVKKWKEITKDKMKLLYNMFGMVEWNYQDIKKRDVELLHTRILMALYGMNRESVMDLEAEDLKAEVERAYKPEQIAYTEKIKTKLLEIYNSTPAAKDFRYSIIYVSCKLDKKDDYKKNGDTNSSNNSNTDSDARSNESSNPVADSASISNEDTTLGTETQLDADSTTNTAPGNETTVLNSDQNNNLEQNSNSEVAEPIKSEFMLPIFRVSN